MKLEIKHLAPYFPYGLNGVADFLKDTVLIVDGIKGNRITGFTKEGNNVPIGCNLNEFIPIFRPLSEFGDSDDLRKVHEFIGLGQWCEAYDQYFDAWFNDACSIGKLVLQAPYEVMQYFLSEHFDVFGLIEAVLAVDINTIPSKNNKQ